MGVGNIRIQYLLLLALVVLVCSVPGLFGELGGDSLGGLQGVTARPFLLGSSHGFWVVGLWVFDLLFVGRLALLLRLFGPPRLLQVPL